MSAISESATIDVMLADYAALDFTGAKANILGIGGNILPITPTGLTARFSLVTQIHAPAKVCPAETSLEISLRTRAVIFSISPDSRRKPLDMLRYSR